LPGYRAMVEEWLAHGHPELVNPVIERFLAGLA
jgi:hypothetical protein